MRVSAAGSNNPMVNVNSTDSNAAFAQFTNSTTGTTASSGFIVGINSTEKALLYNGYSTAIGIYTAGTERLTVASNAYAIGIGTTDIESWSASFAAIEFDASSVVGETAGTSLYLTSNSYNDGSWKRKNAQASIQQYLSNGVAVWRTAASSTADSTITWSEKMRLTNGGTLLVGDTANANMTVGLTLNQGANDDEILAFKSSDVAHGRISTAETDTYLSFKKLDSLIGGARLDALAEDAALANVFRVQAFGGTAVTTKTTSGSGLIDLYATEHDGANNLTNITADGNVFSVRGRVGGANRTLFIIDEDGDFHYDGADGGAFDVYEDAHLVRAFANATSKETVRTAHDDWVQYNE